MLGGLSLAFDVKVEHAISQKSSEGLTFVVYPVALTMVRNGLVHHVERRYSEFLDLYNEIKGLSEMASFSFPGKNMMQIGKVDEGTKNKRKLAFENMMTIIFRMRELPFALKAFLKLDEAPAEMMQEVVGYLAEEPVKSAGKDKGNSKKSNNQPPETAGSSGEAEDAEKQSAGIASDNFTQNLVSRPLFSRARPVNGSGGKGGKRASAERDSTRSTASEVSVGAGGPESNNIESDAVAVKEVLPMTTISSPDASASAAVSSSRTLNSADQNDSQLTVTAPPAQRPSSVEQKQRPVSIEGMPMPGMTGPGSNNPVRIKPRGRRPSLVQKLSLGTSIMAGVSEDEPHYVHPSSTGTSRWLPATDDEWAVQSFNLSKQPLTPLEQGSTTEVIEWLLDHPSLDRVQMARYLSKESHEIILRGVAARACHGKTFMDALGAFCSLSGAGALGLSDPMLITLLAAFATEQTMSENALRSSSRWHEVADLSFCSFELHHRLHVKCSHLPCNTLYHNFTDDIRATTVPPADPVATYPSELIDDLYHKIVEGYLTLPALDPRPSYLLSNVLLRCEMKVVIGAKGAPRRMYVLLDNSALYLVDSDGNSANTKPTYMIALQAISADAQDDDELCTIQLSSMVLETGPGTSLIPLTGYPGSTSRSVQYVLLRLPSNNKMELWLDTLRHKTWVARRGATSRYTTNVVI